MERFEIMDTDWTEYLDWLNYEDDMEEQYNPFSGIDDETLDYMEAQALFAMFV